MTEPNAQPEGHSEVEALLAQVQASQAGEQGGRGDATAAGAAQGGSSGSETASPSVEEEIEVDWGGTLRRVRVADAVEALKAREETAAMQRAVQAQLAQIGSAQQLAQRLQEMTPEQQQLVRQVFQDPSLLHGGRKPAQPDADDPFAILDDGPSPTQVSKAPPKVQQYMGKLEHRLGVLQQAVTQLVQDKVQVSTADRIEKVMEGFPSLQVDSKEGRALASLARRAVHQAVALDPNANLEQVVAQVAATASEGLSVGVTPPGSAVRPAVTNNVTTTQKTPRLAPGQRGDLLESGGIASAVAASDYAKLMR